MAIKANVFVFIVVEPSVLRGALCGHTDAVWGLVYSSTHQRLLSCSSDGTVRLWNASNTSPALAVFNENKGERGDRISNTCFCLEERKHAHLNEDNLYLMHIL